MQNKLQKQFLTHIRIELLLDLFILPSLHSPTGLLAQQEHLIEWVYTHFRGTRSLTPYLDLIAVIIINGRNRTKALICFDLHKIVVPIVNLNLRMLYKLLLLLLLSRFSHVQLDETP